MLSHELRNPLAAVLNADGTLIKKRRRPSPRRSSRCQAVIEPARRSTWARLLDDLLDVSRIAHGKLDLAGRDLELRQPIEAAVEAVQPLFGERGLELVARCRRARAGAG